MNALISTESATRAAGLYYASSPKTGSDVVKACHYALEILRTQPNVGRGLSACAASPQAVNRTSPVALTAASVAAGPDGHPSSTVTVTYQTIPLVPIPVVLPSPLTVTRSVQYKE